MWKKPTMDVIRSATAVVIRTADVTLAVAGAVGGAAVTGAIGGMRGAVNGIKNGMDSGSHSTPAAVLTLAAVGSAGLVEWPVLLGVGGTALVLRRLNDRQPASSAPRLAAVPDDGTARSAGSTRPRKVARPAKKTTKATKPAKATKSAAAGTRRRTSSASRRNPAKR